MSEPAVLLAVAAAVEALGVGGVHVGAPDPLPAVTDAPVLVVARDGAGVVATPLTLRWDQVQYGVEIRAWLGTPRTSGRTLAARAAALAAGGLRTTWTADPTLGGACVEARYAGDSDNLATYRAAKEAPYLAVRLLITEWVHR